jgi:S1-C subfamily serine protease
MSVTAGSPAAKAGIRPGTRKASVGGQTVLLGGDIIRAIDGKRVRSSDDVARMIGAKRPGDSVEIELLRGGKPKTVAVKLGKRPSGTTLVG